MTREIVRGLPADTAEALAWIPYGPFVCGAFLTDEARSMPWDAIYAIAVGRGDHLPDHGAGHHPVPQAVSQGLG